MRALLLLLATAAHADPRSVTGTLRGTTAVFHARYVVALEAPTYARGLTSLAIPDEAAVTRVVVTTPDGEHALDLVDADHATKRFETAGEGSGARRWAVKVDAHGGTLDVSIAAPRAATLTLDVELAMPTCFDRDVRYARVPRAWKRALRTTASAPCRPGASEPERWVVSHARARGCPHRHARRARGSRWRAHRATRDRECDLARRPPARPRDRDPRR